MILLYSLLFVYLNTSFLISYAIFVGGFNSSDVEKKHLQIFTNVSFQYFSFFMMLWTVK